MFLLLATCSQLAIAQSISSEELISRLKLNRSLFDSLGQGPKLSDRSREEGKDISVRRIEMETPTLCDGCAAPDPNNNPDIIRATEESDLVVVGRVVRNISALTTNETFVFTDSEVVIDEVWKSGSRSSKPRIGDEITVASPGGSVLSNGHKISVSVSSRAPLIVGHKFVLFLRSLPSSRSYEPTSLAGFDITGESVAPVRSSMPAQSKLPTSEFLQALHNSSSRATEREK